MALFGHKKRTDNDNPTPAPAKPQNVNPDDIWGAPPSRKASVGQTTVYIKESKYDDVSPETVGPSAIDPETIKKKMAELERELEAQKNKPVLNPADFDTDPVAQHEVSAAQDEFEVQYRIEHERFLAAHENKDIDSANAAGVEQKITDMVEEVEARAKAREALNLDIDHVAQKEVDKGLEGLGVAKDETKDAEYQNIDGVKQSEVDKGLSELGVAKDVTQDKEYKNISSVSDDMLAKKTEEFLKQYGDRKKQD
ncbi:MAG: hypothetical protein IJ555_12140 [Ruminococcus sp.]|nr:hypothetical protein [Ruminococcus sp.]